MKSLFARKLDCFRIVTHQPQGKPNFITSPRTIQRYRGYRPVNERFVFTGLSGCSRNSLAPGVTKSDKVEASDAQVQKTLEADLNRRGMARSRRESPSLISREPPLGAVARTDRIPQPAFTAR